VKDDNGDLFADSNNILSIWESYFSQLLNMHSISDVRHIEMHIDEPLVPVCGTSESEIAIAKLLGYESSSSVQFPAQLIESGGVYDS
jgi:hypothetical protein